MNIQRGDIVLVDYPYTSSNETKVRPVLVIQNDRDNQRLKNTIVVQITSQTQRSLESTQLLIKIATNEGQQSGLRQDSVINCVNLLTLSKDKILKKLGQIPSPMFQKVNDCLKAALELT
ncbi:type II toxin-antitoxin system PemK/MazF family toxin [Pseudanabaena biceps]|nr:type II toxin-antitoxin system PemK/MazF family toxin [Pseudanabaena biceps]